jgi:hypothetical protein
MPETQIDLDAQIEALLDREDWWQLPPDLNDELEAILTELYVEGLNVEASRIEALRRGLDEPPFMALAWDIQDTRVRQLIDTHAAEMVRNVNNGTKYYLRTLIKEGVDEGLGTTGMVERIQRDLFGLPAAEAGKFPRERLQSIVNYETNKAMSGAGHLLRRELGLTKEQWFVNNVSPCEICLGNQAQGVVDAGFQYEGVFGAILYPPAHPQTCRCVVVAVESEVRALGTGPMDWPMTLARETVAA